MLAAGAFALAANQSARASAELTITVGATTVTYTDLGGTGGISTPGGPVGISIGGYQISVGAVTKPALGGATLPELDISSVNVSGGSTTTPLVITFSDISYGPTNGALQLKLSGNDISGNQTVSMSLYGGNSNSLFDESHLLGSVGPLGGNGSTFAGSLVGGVVNSGSYSLTETVTILGVGHTSLDASISSVPDGGSTVAMLGLALVGVGCVRQKLSGLKALVLG